MEIEQADAGRDGRTSRETKFSGANGGREILILPVQLTIRAIRPSFMGIGFGSIILLDLVLFADRIIAEPKSNRSILWDMEVCNDFNGVCAFF